MPCLERASIDRLFDGAALAPIEWDALFAHLRGGCESCAALYSERRAATGAELSMPLSRIESAAILRTLRLRADERAARRRAWWRQPAVWTAVGAACAALLLIVPRVSQRRPYDEDRVETRGGGDLTGVDVSCAPARAGASPVSVVGHSCPAGGDLLVSAVASGTVGATRVSIAGVDRDLKLVSLRDENARPDVPSNVVESIGTDVRGLRIFVLWSVRPLERGRILAALDAARARGATLDSLTTLPIEGVVGQQYRVVSVRREGAN